MGQAQTRQSSVPSQPGTDPVQSVAPSATSTDTSDTATIQLHQNNAQEENTSPWVLINIPELQPAAIEACGIPRPPHPSESALSPPIIYMIRHGEKIYLDDDSEEEPPIGLNYQGFARANTLPLVFNDQERSNPYNIRLIITMQPLPTGLQERPFQTIWPLFLSLTHDNNYCLLDNTIHVGSVQLAARRIKEFIASGSPGNILLCWQHRFLTDILTNFGFTVAPHYPPDFDIVWVLNPTPKPDPKGTLLSSLGDPPPTSVPDKDSYPVLNPDGPGTDLSLWSWNTIEWYAEGINPVNNQAAVVQDYITAKSKISPHALTFPNKNVPNSFITQLTDPEDGPTFAWAPYVHIGRDRG